MREKKELRKLQLHELRQKYPDAVKSDYERFWDAVPRSLKRAFWIIIAVAIAYGIAKHQYEIRYGDSAPPLATEQR